MEQDTEITTDHAVVNGVSPPVREKQQTVDAPVRTSLFWNGKPENEVIWHIPPVPSVDRPEEDPKRNEMMLDNFLKLIPDQPQRAWLLKWQYLTRAAAAANEHLDVENETKRHLARSQQISEQETARLDLHIQSLRSRLKDQQANISDTRQELAESAAKAGISLDLSYTPSTNPNSTTSTASSPEITAQLVDEALDAEVPELHELAGQHGVQPPRQGDFMSMLISFVMQFVAPFVSGSVLALCLGTLIGLMNIDTILRADGLARIAVSAALGFVIVYLMGEVVHYTVALFSHSGTRPDASSNDSQPPPPSIQGEQTVAIGFAAVLFVLAIAEITAEGLGLHMLHQQQLMRSLRFSAPGAVPPTQAPLFVYLLIGTLISCPYLLYKAVRAWREGQTTLSESWLLHRQTLWADTRRRDPEVQRAIHLAHRVKYLQDSIREIQEQIAQAQLERADAANVKLTDELHARRQASRAAVVGETSRIQQQLEDIVQENEPSRQKSAAASPVPPQSFTRSILRRD